jgi:phosphinothricin acetyltransferase
MHGDHGVQVRMASDQDALGIARIYNHYVDGGGATFDTVHWTTEQVIKLLKGPKPEGWLVAVENATVIGWASARLYSLRHGYRFTCETAIYLDPTAVGRGIADLLQWRLEEHCRQCGIHHAVARIIASNERSMAFHRRHGYELVGIQKEIGHMDQKWTDVAMMQKIFQELQTKASSQPRGGNLSS